MQVSDKPGGPRSKDKAAPATIVPNTNKHATQGKIKWSLTCKRNQNHNVKHQLRTYVTNFVNLIIILVSS